MILQGLDKANHHMIVVMVCALDHIIGWLLHLIQSMKLPWAGDKDGVGVLRNEA